jgi:hypothetical protein
MPGPRPKSIFLMQSTSAFSMSISSLLFSNFGPYLVVQKKLRK